MYSEVVNGVILQTVSDGVPITTQDGTQYPANYPKDKIPNLLQVTEPAAPNPSEYTVVSTDYQLINGVPTLVYNTQAIPLSTMQDAQMEAISIASNQAQEAPIPFTTAAGVTSNFPMDEKTQHKFHLAYTTYVLGGVALPNPFPVIDINGSVVDFVLADLKGFFEAGMARGQAAVAKQGGLNAQIKVAKTLAAIQAVTW